MGMFEQRCLYRALLREATYLPNACLRKYAHKRITEKARGQKLKVEDLRGKHQVSEYEKRVDKHTISARTNLRKLQRATAGEHAAVLDLASKAFGRTGKRKFELLTAFLKDEKPVLTELQRSKSTSEPLSLVPRPPEPSITTPASFYRSAKLQALVLSQQGNQPVDGLKKIKDIVPSFPATNIWGEPMSWRLESNKRKRFYADLLDRVFPPLPKHEWNLLRSLAVGDKLETVPKRRPIGNWHFVDEQVLTERGSPTGSPKIAWPAKAGQQELKLSERTRRRIWFTVWSHCSFAERDEELDKWKFTWGGGGWKTPDFNVFTQPSVADMELFENLDFGEDNVKRRKVKGRRGKKLQAC